MREHKINIEALSEIRADIQKHSPHPSLVNIVAVTKTFNHTAILSAKKNSLPCVGENKVQEFLSKKEECPSVDLNIETHLIGHLQSNKTNKAVGVFNVIQTVDSLKIANKINIKAQEKNIQQKVFIQINIGEDPNKHGFMLDTVYHDIETITKLTNLKVTGLMTILPFNPDTKTTQPLFAAMKQTQDQILQKINPDCRFLSMGMSRDYIYALKEGATHLRIGTKLYGQRT